MNSEIISTKHKCLNIGFKNRFGDKKEYSCLDLPPSLIHKAIREWLCFNCAEKQVRFHKLKQHSSRYGDDFL